MFVFFCHLENDRKIEIWRPVKIHYFLIANPCREGGGSSRPQMMDYHWGELNWIETELNCIESKLNWFEIKLNSSWIEMFWIEFEIGSKSECNWLEIEFIWHWNEIDLKSNRTDFIWCGIWNCIHNSKLNCIRIEIDVEFEIELNLNWSRNWDKVDWIGFSWFWIQLNWIDIESILNWSWIDFT